MVEWLGHIVVGARPDRANRIMGLAVSGKHDHGHRFIVRFGPSQDLEAVHVR